MNTSRFARALVLFLLATPVLLAAEDLTGKWGGTFVFTEEGQPHDDVAHMVAKQTGAELTGTVGPNPDKQFPILKGKIETTKEAGKESTKVTFDVEPNGAGGPVMHFLLALVDGHLKGNAKGEHDGQTMSATVDLTRLK